MVVDIQHFRQNIVAKLNEQLSPFGITKSAENIEIGVLNWSLKEAKRLKIVKKWENPYFLQLYKDHLRSVYINLSEKNERLIEQLKDGSILFKDIAFLSHQDFHPDKWTPVLESIMKRNKNRFGQKEEASTTQFTCRKCHKNQCSYYLLQIRSADEPMTAFIRCCNCGNRWRQG
jgi:DNA-directed RNA polymerase subunit M/transcription elongation factor TFIIS